jgi:predicted phage tail protein
MCPICLAAEIDRLRAERDDLMNANALLHALIGNRERDIAALEADIEQLRTALKDGWSTLALFNVKNYHPTLVTLQAQLLAGLTHQAIETS